jgi:hypothetical protein
MDNHDFKITRLETQSSETQAGATASAAVFLS